MFNSHPLKSRFIVFILLPLLLMLGLSWQYLSQSLPQIEGQIKVKGLTQAVSLTRDEQGVVHIEAKTDKDAYFAVGYAHAQDRMWQLELQRRISQGRLSELFGIRMLSHDTWMRTLDLYQSAQSAWQALSPQAQSALNAYSAGINAWLDGAKVLPPEFISLDITPAAWTPIDSLAWTKVFALNISGNMSKEINNLIISKNLEPQQIHSLYQDYPKDAPVTVANMNSQNEKSLVSLLQLQKQIEQDLHIGGQYVGSNAWVVSGKHSENGQAVLANDPHLGLQIPSLWYVASIKGDKLDVSGMTLIGIPNVIFGRNQSISWGGTAMMADVQDLYIEQISPEQPNDYRTENGWETFEIRTEQIEIKAEFPAQLRNPVKPVEIKLRKTRHGPLVTRINGTFEQPVSLRWSALDPGDTTFESFYRLNYASNWSSFKAALKLHVAPSLNVLYADKDNNIGYMAAGKIPIRAKGNGQLPVPGWNGEYEWQGYIPFEQLPQDYNPQKGYLVSANNKVIGSDYPYFISQDWAPPARAQRIETLIQEKIAKGERLDLKYHQQMHGDFVDVSIIELLQIMQNYKGNTERQRQAVEKLKQWHGEMAIESSAAAIFHAWARHIRKQLFSDDLSGFWNKPDEFNSLRVVVAEITNQQIVSALNDKQINWCDVKGSQEIESCNDVIETSLVFALDELSGLVGSDIDDWQWGDVHMTMYDHSPFSQVDFLAPLFGRKVASGGSTNTINVANASFVESKGYQQTFGAGFRQIIQFTDDEVQHKYMNSTGQSGHMLSSNYADMVKPFGEVRYYDLNPTAAQTEQSILQLVPD